MKLISGLIRLIVGLVGLIALAVGVLAVIFEVGVLTAGDGRATKILGEVWYRHDPFAPLVHTASLQLLQVFFERKLHQPSLWDPGITTILNWPAWLGLLALMVVGLVVGVVLLAMALPSRRHRRFA